MRNMKYTSGIKKLGLPDYFKFGIELEAYNVQTKGKGGLYTGERADYIKSKNYHMATKHEESLVGQGGAELVSPILRDSEADWQNLSDICVLMKQHPGNKGEHVIADEKCGLHVHFDSQCLTQDSNRMHNFLRLYAEAEELIYKMCNAPNNPIRKGAINKDFKGLHLISSIWRNGMASPSSKKILKHIQDGTLKVSYKNFGKLKTLAGKLKLDERRYHGLNLTNIGNSKKNTIEFRMANGTLEPEVIKQTVFLYASLIDTAIKTTDNPELYEEKLAEFYRTDLTEEQKVQSFLSLIMENPADREIYMERWQSVKDAKVFAQNSKKGFAQNRFKREQFQAIANRTPATLVKEAYAHIKDILSRDYFVDKGDVEYDR
jgi:hypothetical protein